MSEFGEAEWEEFCLITGRNPDDEKTKSETLTLWRRLEEAFWKPETLDDYQDDEEED